MQQLFLGSLQCNTRGDSTQNTSVTLHHRICLPCFSAPWRTLTDHCIVNKTNKSSFKSIYKEYRILLMVWRVVNKEPIFCKAYKNLLITTSPLTTSLFWQPFIPTTAVISPLIQHTSASPTLLSLVSFQCFSIYALCMTSSYFHFYCHLSSQSSSEDFFFSVYLIFIQSTFTINGTCEALFWKPYEY